MSQDGTPINDWERVKELLVEVDARLRAFTDREVKYYITADWACVKVHALMFLPKEDKAAMLQFTVSRPGCLAHPSWSAARLAHSFVHTWLEKIKMPRKYGELDVVLDSPPSWAKVAAE